MNSNGEDEYKTYGKASIRILEEARSEYARKKKERYTREQAFDDLTEVQEEITAQLESSEQSLQYA